MKKEGIMRINSYNKFFAKVAHIMNTAVKAVKPLDGRYKVELANHVYLNVYRGVGGSLFIHDHSGISNTTSCYDFEDFKTMKDLYERLVSDYSESAKKEVMEVRQELNSRLGKAAKNHVSLRTLANIDNGMVDEKRQFYMHLYYLLKDFRKYAFEITRREVYFDLVRNVRKDIQQGYFNNKISIKAYNYACRHIESVSVEKNYFTSSSEKAFGYKESKRYKITLR